MDDVDREYLADMLRYAETATRLLGSADVSVLNRDEVRLLAVWKAVEILGEAANQVSREGRSRLPEIPWPRVIGMRHHLVHGYRKVRAQVLVDTINTNLPPLIASLRRALEEISQ